MSPSGRGQSTEQQRRFDRTVESGSLADPTRTGPPGIQNHQHVAVAFGPPGPHQHVVGTCGGPPVDAAHVVARHVLAERIELGALPARIGDIAPLEMMQPLHFRTQQPLTAKRGQRAHPGRHLDAALPSGQPQWSEQSKRHRTRNPITAIDRSQAGTQADSGVRGQIQVPAVDVGAGTVGPGVPQHAAHGGRAGIGDHQFHLGVATEPHHRQRITGQRQRIRPRGERDIGQQQRQQHRARAEHPDPCRHHEHHHRRRDGGEQRESACDHHVARPEPAPRPATTRARPRCSPRPARPPAATAGDAEVPPSPPFSRRRASHTCAR